MESRLSQNSCCSDRYWNNRDDGFRMFILGSTYSKFLRLAFVIAFILSTVVFVLFVLASCSDVNIDGDKVDVGLLVDASDMPTGMSGAYTNRIWDRLMGGANISDALVLEGFKVVKASNQMASSDSESNSLSESAAPAWLYDEVIGDENFQSIVINSDNTLVCVLDDCSCEEVLGRIDKGLGRFGWFCITGESEEIRNYIKEEGECRWLMMEGIEVDGMASVVLHIQHA